MICDDRWIGFPVVREGLRSANFTLSTDSLLPVFCWTDAFVAQVHFSRLRPWQIINRIPNSDFLCNKVELARAILTLPSGLRDFWPRTFILPQQEEELSEELEARTETFIVKPADGSLGAGVRLYRPGRRPPKDSKAAIAQVYVESLLYNSHKLDLRVYVLVTAVNPLEIFVYRDGVTRFCALSAGVESRYSYLTNIALNSNFPGERSGEILELISDFFPRLGVDLDGLWMGIDRIAILTILSVYWKLVVGEREECPRIGFSRCFQLFGFDILLDERLRPWLLEVNYRPSLKFMKARERRMKENLVRDLATLFGGLRWVQEAVLSRKYGWSKTEWDALMEENSKRIRETEADRVYLAERTLFSQVWPTENAEFISFQTIIEANSCVSGSR
jgi:hypothetical protein